MAQTDIFVDVETGVILDGFDSTLRAPAQSFTYGDTLDLNVTGVRRNQGVDSADTPWSVIDMTAKDFRVAIGTTDRLPFDGAFTVNASDSIDHDALAPAVETALNADATITAEGGVTVTGLAAGGWRVTFVTDGAKTALAGNENTLLPSSSIYLDLQRAGDTNVQEVWMLRIETSPSAYAQLVTDIPAPTVAISQVRNGSIASSISEVQAVTMTGTATGGTYALTLDGVATGEISHNADDIEIQEAIALLPIVGGDIDLITVTGDARAFTVSFDSTLGDLSAMTVDDSNLVGLTGKSGEFNLNTLEIIELLNGQQSNTGFFEIVLYDTDNSQGETVSLSSVAVVQDIIPDSPPSVTPVVEYADKIHTHPISDITGLQANLTDIEADVDALEARDWVDVTENSVSSSADISQWASGVVSVMMNTTSDGYPLIGGIPGGAVTVDRRANVEPFLQTAVRYWSSYNNGEIHTSQWVSGAWTPWVKVITSEDVSTTEVIVKTAADLSGTLDSTKAYKLDGIIDMGSQSITVPTGGLSIIGDTFDVSGLTSSEDNYTMFVSESIVIGSGNLLMKDLKITTDGASSKVYELYDATGFNAVELLRVNYIDCTSLGELYDYRQGLEDGTGRFGGSPSLTLEGIWLGGFRISTSIVRSLAGTMTEPIFKAGALFQMNSRFITDINCDLPTLAALLDFAPVNFPNASTLQLKGCEITRDGSYVSEDANITPNISQSDLPSYWKLNNGVLNTFVGGTTIVVVEETTTVVAASTYYDLEGIFLGSGLQHFEASSDGKLTHLGSTPAEYEVTSSLILESTSNDDLTVRFRKWDDSASAFINLDYTEQTRQVNNLQGGRDVANFTLAVGATLDQNDYLQLQVRNNSGSNDVTAELSSFFRVQER